VPSLLLVGPDGDELLSRSDHWSYLQAGVPAVMVTDTAEFRNPNYHGRGDRPGTLDYARMAHAVEALRRVVIDLAERPPAPVVVESRRLTIRNTRSEAVRVVVPSTELDRELAPGEALTIDVAGFAAIRLVGVATVRVGSQDISVEGDSDALVAITRGDGVPMGNVGRNRGSWLRTGPIGVGGVVIGE
jgi:hypothetical protein